MKGLREPIVILVLSAGLIGCAIIVATVPLQVPHGVAIAFAAAAAAITLIWSMELRHEPPLVQLLVALGFVFVAVLMGFTIFDIITR